MKIRFMLALLAVAAASMPAFADEKIVIKSRTLKNMGEAFNGAPGEPVEIEGDLRFPSSAGTRFPAMILPHTIGGFRESNEG